MAARNPQTMAKRAREMAVKEKRDRKRAKKQEAAALRAAGDETVTGDAPAPDSAPQEPDSAPQETE